METARPEHTTLTNVKVVQLHSTASQRVLDAQLAIGHLIATGGNAALAAVNASKELGDDTGRLVSQAQLLATIASEPDSLSTIGAQVKLLLLLKTLEAFRLTHDTYTSFVPRLEPKDVAKAYVSMLAAMSNLTQGASARPVDPLAAIMSKLPPEVQDAVKFFVEQDQQNTAALTLEGLVASGTPETPTVTAETRASAEKSA